MIKLLTIFALFLILAVPAKAANVTIVEIRGAVFDENSNIYNTTLEWDGQNYTNFFYVLGSSEILKIDQPASTPTNASRVIEKEKLIYKTWLTDQKYSVFSEKGKKVENGLEYNSTNKTFTKNIAGGYYAQLMWFGDTYVAVNGKVNKLARLLINHGTDVKDKKTLQLGTVWSLGEGYNLTVESIDTSASTRQAWLSLTKDGKTLDNKIVNEGEVYTYVDKSVSGESDVPVFVTYVESIFSGAEGMANHVQFRYTWLISQNVFKVKAGDKFGVFEVKEADENHLLLYNKDKQISLDQNSVIDIYKDIKFKVADSSTVLRFYPFVEKTLPGKYEVRGGDYDQNEYYNLIWDAQRFPGFWYEFGSGKSSENLTVDQTASSLTNTSRIIEKEKLLYNTWLTDKKYSVFSEKGKNVENGLEYNSTNKIFTKNTGGGYYAQLVWFGDTYVVVNGKANKLVRLLINNGTDVKDKKTLIIGETWNLGENYSLTVSSIDAKASPKQAHLIFYRDGNKLDERAVTEGQVYTYVQKNLAGESDVPVFVTYIESIFAGTASDIVQLRYTWQISQDVIEIKAGDKFGVFELKENTEDHLLLYNKDKSISLDQNTVVDLANGLKFKVADNATALRFYPFVEHTIQAISYPETKDATQGTTTFSAITVPATTPVASVGSTYMYF